MKAQNEARQKRLLKQKYAPQGSMSRNVYIMDVLQKGKRNLSRAEKEIFSNESGQKNQG